MRAGVVAGQRRDVVEARSLDHLAGHVAPKVGDLLANVAQEGVAGPPPQQHDGADRHMVQVHGHGGGGPARMQPDFLRSDAQAAAVNGPNVGPEKLEGDGASDVGNFP